MVLVHDFSDQLMQANKERDKPIIYGSNTIVVFEQIKCDVLLDFIPAVYLNWVASI